MNSKLIKYLTIIFISITIVSFSYTIFIDGDKDEILLEAITQTLIYRHYNNLEINDDFSEKVYNQYLNKLDFGKRYLTLKDIKMLESYKYKIDDAIKSNSYDFFNISYKLVNDRIKGVKKIFTDILSKPFDFNKDENIEIDIEKYNFAKDEKDLKERWRKLLKYETMIVLARKIKSENKKKKDKKSQEQLEKESRKKILKTYTDWHKRIVKHNRSDRRSDFLNSIAGIYDPHTEYYPPKEKEDFEARISGQYEGIGAILQASGQFIKVVRLFPGSASWKQGQLKAGDIIMKVAQGGKEPTDITDMRIDDVVKLIKGAKGTEVRLTVRKRDNKTVVVPIVRDIVVMEETFAKSAVINNNNKKIGYINLPGFYTSFSHKGRNCSQDVEKEIEKLKKENIEGIIIDLRNNGGGSLPEVIKMAGLFIEKGPIVQIKTQKGSPYIYKDEDARIQYKGKIIVMVNTFSASASEIFAAAIQDYNRGIIVGSSSTWGKGTVQRILDFDNYISDKWIDLKPLGALKITVQKYYRIDGSTTQKLGVKPDIVIPDLYSKMEIGEREQKFALSWDKIDATNYAKWKYNYNIDSLKNNSIKRMSNNDEFKLIKSSAQRLHELSKRTHFSLNLEKHIAYNEKRSKDDKKIFDMTENVHNYSVFASKVDSDKNKNDTIKIASNKQWYNELKKDIYLNETVKIMNDILKK